MGRIIMIESAINGNAARELNPNIPYSPLEIADDAIATTHAGAALIHFHVRDPQTGRWVQDVPYYAEVYRRTREVCDPLLWPTFPFDGTPAERFHHFVELAKDSVTKPDLGAADMGSVNLATYIPRSKKIRGAGFVYQNSYETCRQFLEMSRELGLRPTLQIFEPGFLRAALVFLDQGLITEPLILKFYLGGPEQNFGLPPTMKSLEAYLAMIEGVRCNWFAATLGGDNLPLVPAIASLGGHVRVGLEDYQYARDGQLSNPQIVERAAAMIRAMGHEVATSRQAREILEVQ
ncbi:MAG TPA: 3-keto-5-aminohexanoate cleavage protein [Candidatus Binataceae bacterium]|nr:3-keto-5-aminohexanoate cleavage protein [Candidatus Binataceae bacterium]